MNKSFRLNAVDTQAQIKAREEQAADQPQELSLELLEQVGGGDMPTKGWLAAEAISPDMPTKGW